MNTIRAPHDDEWIDVQELRRLLPDLPTLRVWFNDGNPNNQLIHVRGIVDGRVVHRSYSRKWGGAWRYELEMPGWLELLAEKRHLARG